MDLIGDDVIGVAALAAAAVRQFAHRRDGMLVGMVALLVGQVAAVVASVDVQTAVVVVVVVVVDIVVAFEVLMAAGLVQRQTAADAGRLVTAGAAAAVAAVRPLNAGRGHGARPSLALGSLRRAVRRSLGGVAVGRLAADNRDDLRRRK